METVVWWFRSQETFAVWENQSDWGLSYALHSHCFCKVLRSLCKHASSIGCTNPSLMRTSQALWQRGKKLAEKQCMFLTLLGGLSLASSSRTFWATTIVEMECTHEPAFIAIQKKSLDSTPPKMSLVINCPIAKWSFKSSKCRHWWWGIDEALLGKTGQAHVR